MDGEDLRGEVSVLFLFCSAWGERGSGVGGVCWGCDVSRVKCDLLGQKRDVRRV